MLGRMDTMHTIFRSARGFFCGTFLSRLSGFCRDMAMAFCFGGSAEVGAFLVAFRLANLFRRMLGEGNLQAGFIPHFESLRKESFEEAVHFYRETALFLGGVSGAVVVASEGILWMMLGELDESWREIAVLTMWMLPGLLFICLSGLNQALLQSQKRYFFPSASPAVFNGVWILAAVCTQNMRWLAVWITLGCALQWALSSWEVRKEFSKVEKRQRRWFSLSCRKLVGLMTLGLIGTAAVQVNSALDAIFARLADLSGPVYLWYAIRMQQLPLALFGLALSGALLPPLSRAYQNGDWEKFYGFLRSSLRRVAVLMIPSSFGLMALSGVGLNFLYGHGHFGIGEVERTADCLFAYSVGLIPSVFILLYSQGCYAQKNYRGPAKASLISVLVNIFLNALFVFGCEWGAMSIALATSVSAFVNGYLLSKELPDVLDRSLLRLCQQLILAAVVASLVVWGVQQVSFDGLGATSVEKAWQLGFLSLVYLGTFLGMSSLLKLEEVWSLLKRNPKPEV